MVDEVCLNKNYSTTCLLTKEKPIIENRSEDKFESVLFLTEGEKRKGEGGLRTQGYFKKSYEEKPLISVITVVYNGEEFLEKTIQSVINQSYDNVEYIIIDGGSTDATVDIIKKYEDKINYWVSEKDTGIYDAMNKGIKVSMGEGLLFLNAGDYFVGNVLNDKIKIPCFLPLKFNNIFNKLVDMKIKSYTLGLPYGHQGILFENKKILYDTNYDISADYKFYLEHNYIKLNMIKMNNYIYYDNNGVSSLNRKKRDKEISLIIKDKLNYYYIKFKLYVKIKDLIRLGIKK